MLIILGFGSLGAFGIGFDLHGWAEHGDDYLVGGVMEATPITSWSENSLTSENMTVYGFAPTFQGMSDMYEDSSFVGTLIFSTDGGANWHNYWQDGLGGHDEIISDWATLYPQFDALNLAYGGGTSVSIPEPSSGALTAAGVATALALNKANAVQRFWPYVLGILGFASVVGLANRFARNGQVKT